MKPVLRTILYPFALSEIHYAFICSYPYNVSSMLQ